MPTPRDDALLRATLAYLAEPHAARDDEDLHPPRLDPAEAALERALVHANPPQA